MSSVPWNAGGFTGAEQIAQQYYENNPEFLMFPGSFKFSDVSANPDRAWTELGWGDVVVFADENRKKVKVALERFEEDPRFGVAAKTSAIKTNMPFTVPGFRIPFTNFTVPEFLTISFQVSVRNSNSTTAPAGIFSLNDFCKKVANLDNSGSCPMIITVWY